MSNENLPKGLFANTKEEKPEDLEKWNRVADESNEEDGSEEQPAESSRKNSRRGRVQRLKTKDWMIYMLIFILPFVNIAECIYVMVTKKHPDAERWAKAAIVPACIVSLIVLIIILRLHYMTYADCMKFVQLFQ